ncbi:sugar kinase [Bradyrhizobium iriomotense]|uniref:Sugar kinase n=2 Tax=Bradyrhizobium iriomotense TaxID=441950 RepID=A0ABQ6AUJ8_9BRAD|nr:sugar kinase [Bradyrhizobium iriomotense]
MMGLNRSSSGNIIAELTAAGFVREVQDDATKQSGYTRAGRPGILLELSAEAAFFLGAEVGVEHITTVEIDLAANIVRSTIEPFDARSVPVEEAIRRAVAQAFRDVPQHKLGLCEGFGLSAPAQMDGNGHVSIGPILGWRDVDLNELTRAALPIDVPVLAENDANAFAIGATYTQADARSGVTMFMVIESGVGGGIAIDGKLFRGGRGLAGEVGHLKVPDREERNLEQAIGLGRIMDKYRSSTGRADVRLVDFLGDVRDRVPAAIVIAEDWARMLAFAIVQVSRLIDPDRIVLGGSLAELYPLVAARVAAHIRELQAPTFPIPDIVLNESAAYGSALGAACMMHQRFLSLNNERFADDPSEGNASTS